LLHTTTMINLYMHLELYNKIIITKNKERFFKMKCVFLSYIIQVKMKRKAMNVVKFFLKKTP
jgi:hypothetical protein